MITQQHNHFSSFGFYRKENLDKRQKNQNALKEGFIVNSFIKGTTFETTVLIPQKKEPIPEIEPKKENTKKPISSVIFPLCAASIGVTGLSAAFSVMVKKASGMYKDTASTILPGVSRFISINDDNLLSIYYACKDRSKASIMAASVVLIATAFSFVSKNVIDGFKEIWVKKKEADIQKDMQEKLIGIETRSFKGKNQVVKNMLVDTKNKLDEINSLTVFKGNENKEQQGKEQETPFYEKNWFYGLSLIATLGISLFFTRFAYKNICQIDKDSKVLSKHAIDKLKELSPLELIKRLKENPQIPIEETMKIFNESNSKIKAKLDDMAKTLSSEQKIQIEDFIKNNKKDELLSFIEGLLNPVKNKKTEEKVLSIADNIINSLEQKQKQFLKDNNIFAEAPNSYYGFADKAYFSSVVSEATSYLYAMLLSPNKVTKNLFSLIAGYSGLSYIGTKLVEGIKDIQVKKQNANIEINLHDKLVETEIKNFKAKKESIINPLIEEYQNYKKTNPQNSEKLQKMYNNILEEIQNGPPFVYS